MWPMAGGEKGRTLFAPSVQDEPGDHGSRLCSTADRSRPSQCEPSRLRRYTNREFVAMTISSSIRFEGLALTAIQRCEDLVATASRRQPRTGRGSALAASASVVRRRRWDGHKTSLQALTVARPTRTPVNERGRLLRHRVDILAC